MKDTKKNPAVKRFLLALLILGSVHPFMAQSEASEEESPFLPAEVLSVTDIPLPILCSMSWGFVALDVPISETGEVQKVEVRRDIPCLTSLAVQAVEKWKFSPATMAGNPLASRMLVVVTFRPPSPFSDPVPLPALKPQSEVAIQAEFQPAALLHAVFPPYRYRGYANAAGTVVLQVALNPKGEAEKTKVLLELDPFTEEVKSVVKDWRFMPATLNGRPVPSQIVLAFESPSPTPLSTDP